MSLKVELLVEKSTLLLQENCLIRVTITNEGRDPVTALAPPRCYTLPGFKLVNVKTGWEKVFRREKSLFSRETPETIAPGQSLTAQYPLFDFIIFPGPGEFELSAIWEWGNGQGKAFSEPVALSVTETRPVQLALAPASGSPGTMWNGVWVNAAGEKPSFCRLLVETALKPAVTGIASLGPIDSASAKPSLSVPPSGGFTSDQWTAWFERDTLRIGLITVKPDPKIALTELMLSPVPKLLVPPLNHIDTATGVEGRFFLWQGTPDGMTSRFQTVHLSQRGEPEAGANAMLTGAQPSWVHAAFLKDGRARTYALAKIQTPAQAKAVTPQTSENLPGTVGLVGVEWGADNQPVLPAKTLAQWDGEAIAGGLIVTDAGDVHGAVLVYGPGAAPDRVLTLQPWTQKADGSFTAGDAIKVPREPAQQPDSAQIALSPQGDPAFLIRFQKGGRFIFRQQFGLKPLMGSAGDTDEPLVLFFPGTLDPLILGTDPESHAFLVMDQFGSPLGIPLST